MNKNNVYSIVLQILLLLIFTEKIFSFDLSDSEKEWVENISPLKFSEVEWEPLSYVNEYPEYKGIIADYLNIISSETGIEMDFVRSRTWQEVLDKFVSRDIDLIPALATGDSVGTTVLLTDPYTSFPLVIVTKPEIDFISYTHELNGKKVGVGEGYTSCNFLKNNYPDIELVEYPDVKDGLISLEKGKIFAFVGHMAVVKSGIIKNKLDLHIAGKTEFKFEHRIGLPEGHEKTINIFNRVLDTITPEEHNRIYNKWIKIDVVSNDYSLVLKILFSSIIIILCIILWNRKLSAEKRQIQELFFELRTLKNQLEAKNSELNQLAITDQLTGLYNRIKLDEALKYEISRFARYKNSFGIIIIDIDHFKLINDTYGHPAGDTILVSISRLLLLNIRKADILGRWGGEEFLIICPEINKDGIEKLMEKLRKTIEAYTFPDVRTITASFGAAVYNSNDDLLRLIKRADNALYFSKNNGRNQAAFK